MKWKNSLLCTAAMVVLAGVTCYILLKDHSMGTLWAVLKNADLRFVLLGLFLMVLFVGCEAAVIRLLAGTWGGSVPWKRAMQYSFAGFYFSSITPSSTGGQPMQLYYMVRDGMSAARSSFALLTITAMYQLMALAYGVGMGLLKFSYLMGLPLALKLLICFGILANGISVAFILLILFCRPLDVYKRQGAIPSTHPLYAGNIGIHGSFAANSAVSGCDVLFSIGTRFNDRITGKNGEFAKHASIIHVDIDPASISRTIAVDIPIVADAGAAIHALLEKAVPLDTDEWRKQIDGLSLIHI